MTNAFDKLLENEYFDILYKKGKYYYFYIKITGIYQRFPKSTLRNPSCLFELAPMKFWNKINSHKSGRLHIKNCAALLEESFNLKGATK